MLSDALAKYYRFGLGRIAHPERHCHRAPAPHNGAHNFWNQIWIFKWNKDRYVCSWWSERLDKWTLVRSSDQFASILHNCIQGLGTPGEEIAFATRPKIHSHSQIFRYDRSIFCLPHRPKFSDFFDLYLHWVSVVRDCIAM